MLKMRLYHGLANLPASEMSMLGEDTVPYDAEEAAWQGWQAGEFRRLGMLRNCHFCTTPNVDGLTMV